MRRLFHVDRKENKANQIVQVGFPNKEETFQISGVNSVSINIIIAKNMSDKTAFPNEIKKLLIHIHDIGQ